MIVFSEYEVYKTLRELAEKTFPDEYVKAFKIEFDYKKASKTKNTDYKKKEEETAVITVFNFDRSHNHIITTTIQELAHHCDLSFNGSDKDSKETHKIYKLLLEQAHKDSIVDLAEAKQNMDSKELEKLEKKVGALEYKKVVSDAVVVKINNYDQREILKEDEYKFSPTEKLWVKEYENTDLADEAIEKYIDAGVVKETITIVSKAENIIESTYYVIFGKDCFDVKDDLKKAGAFFDKDKGWYKKIKLTEKEEMEALAEELGISKVKYTTSIK